MPFCILIAAALSFNASGEAAPRVSDRTVVLTWDDAAELHEMGFEIGNHTCTHDGFGDPGADVGAERR